MVRTCALCNKLCLARVSGLANQSILNDRIKFIRKHCNFLRGDLFEKHCMTGLAFLRGVKFV